MTSLDEFLDAWGEATHVDPIRWAHALAAVGRYPRERAAWVLVGVQPALVAQKQLLSAYLQDPTLERKARVTALAWSVDTHSADARPQTALDWVVCESARVVAAEDDRSAAVALVRAVIWSVGLEHDATYYDAARRAAREHDWKVDATCGVVCDYLRSERDLEQNGSN